MYAVIETGGKQYRVEVGTELEVELLAADPGQAVTLDRVLLVADGETTAIGRPLVANASVAAEVIRRDRGEKVISFKYRPKARRRVKKGHRQELTVLRISDIVLDGKSAAADVAKATEERQTERRRVEELARKQAEADAALAAQLAAARAAQAATESKAKAAPAKAPAQGSAKTPAKAPAKAPAPRARAAKAAPTPTPEETPAAEAAPEKPKRTRATRKDA